MAKTAKKATGKGVAKKATNNTTSTKKENAMKTRTNKTAKKETAKKVTTKPAAPKTQVVQKPTLYGTKFVLPATVTELAVREVGVNSMEASMQRMIVQEYSQGDMFKIFRAQNKWSDRSDKWITDRVQKYFMQERHWMEGSHPAAKGVSYMIIELHSIYRSTITRRANAAKKKESKKSA